MKTLFILVSMMVVLFLAAPNKVEAQKKTALRIIDGTITEYSCGDNCYLTITDKKGKKHTGLCTARPFCTTWNAETEMPDSYKGKKVRVTVGKAPRYDGSGNVMDRYDAFTKIQFLAEPQSVNNIKLFINDLAKAVSTDDKNRLAQMINFPLVDEWGDNPTNESAPLGCKTADQFFEKYDKIFTQDIKRAITAKKYRGWVKNVFVGDVIKKGEYLIPCFSFEDTHHNRPCNMFGIKRVNGNLKIYAIKFYS